MTIPYECSQMHNGKPVTVIVPDLAVPKCSHCGELTFDYEADEQISRAFEAVILKERPQQAPAVATSAIDTGKEHPLPNPTSSSS